MKFLKDFGLYLFDFDGLLVNTEFIHYQAYIDMLKKRGFDLDWAFIKFCEVAHYDDQSLKEGIYNKFPDLLEKEPNWEILRKEKNNIYLSLLISSKIELMPGAEKLLKALEKDDIARCVVTNSSKDMIDLIKNRNSVLQSISHWITREDYLNPKPDPECYLKAIRLFAKKNDKVIGFEDSLRGIKALMQTPAQPVMIGGVNDPRKDAILSSDVLHFESLEDFLKS